MKIDPQVILPSLIRLRWLAVVGQGLSILAAGYWLHLPINLDFTLAALAITVVTNLTLSAGLDFFLGVADDAAGMVLVLDTATLTLLLHATGGAHHPFAVFYLLHLTLAGLMLSPRWIAGVLLVSIACLAWLNLGHGDDIPVSTVPPHLREQGTLVAVGLAGIFIAYFAGRVQADLRASQARGNAQQVRLARHERFAGVATLSAGLAHELSTPLATIMLISRELERATSTPETREDIRVIRQEAERCRTIMSRLEAHLIEAAPEPIELHALGPAVVAILPAVHRSRLHVSLPTGIYFQAPRLALIQCLGTIAKNAAEADPSGQMIELTVVETHEDVTFVVADHGPGVPPQASARLGEPFFTTKAPGVGTGLGLYIVRMFADRLGGQLTFHARAGGGTEVHLQLPRAASPAS